MEKLEEKTQELVQKQQKLDQTKTGAARLGIQPRDECV